MPHQTRRPYPSQSSILHLYMQSSAIEEPDHTPCVRTQGLQVERSTLSPVRNENILGQT
jgi:hypothetical protein